MIDSSNHDGIFSHIPMLYTTEKIWFAREEYCHKQNKGCNPWDVKEIRKGFKFIQMKLYPFILNHHYEYQNNIIKF